jgi:hypothetical protein
VAGLAAIVDDGTLGEYLAGIWSKNIAVGLSWGRPWALLKKTPSYRAPSWSWASLDGRISSSVLFWSNTLMEEHAHDPDWISRYGLKLLEHHMVARNPSNPYMGVLEGSYIVVEGACMGITQFLELVGNELFYVTPVLDKANTFDCPCCGPKSTESPSGQDKAEKSKNPEDHMPFNVVMVTQGNAWRTEDSSVDILLLKWVDQARHVLERVGTAILRANTISYGQEFNSEALHKAFDTAGWERKPMKLV